MRLFVGPSLLSRSLLPLQAMDAQHPDGEHQAHIEDDDREATELRERQLDHVAVIHHPPLPASTPSSPSKRLVEQVRKPLSNFWKHQVSTTVPHDDCRDHFGMY